MDQPVLQCQTGTCANCHEVMHQNPILQRPGPYGRFVSNASTAESAILWSSGVAYPCWSECVSVLPAVGCCWASCCLPAARRSEIDRAVSAVPAARWLVGPGVPPCDFGFAE